SRRPSYTLFPYTTLFRSDPRRQRQRIGVGLLLDGEDDGGSADGLAVLLQMNAAFAALDRAGEAQIGDVLDLHGARVTPDDRRLRSEEHTSELQSRFDLVC